MLRCAGPPLAVKTSRSKLKQWCVTETAKFKNDQPDDEQVDLLQFRKKIAWLQMLLSIPPVREPNAKLSLFADLDSGAF